MRKIFVTLALSVSGLVAMAQQDPQFTQNMFNRLATNPGYAGTNKAICGTLLYRSQWVNFDGAPKTGLLSLDMPVAALHGGVGLTVANDRLGFDKSTMVKLAYSYHQPLGPGTLGIGVEAGLFQKTLGGDWVATQNYQTDPSIPQNILSEKTYDLGFGLYYSTQQMYFGLASTHLPQQVLKGDNNIAFTFSRHYYVNGGYKFRLSETFELEPSVFVKSDAASTQLDVNARVIWQNTLWAGVTYRLNDAVAPLIGIQRPAGKNGTLKAGYAYDVTTSQIKNYSSGSHELFLNYCYAIVKPKKVESHRNPRFL